MQINLVSPVGDRNQREHCGCLKVLNMELVNDKTKVEMMELLNIEASNYASKSGNRLLFWYIKINFS